MRLPRLLIDTDDDPASEVLSCYYGLGNHAHHGVFTGSWFDTWDPASTRAEELNRFTANDLVAVSFLSVDVPATAAMQLLVKRAEVFSSLLVELGPDRDLVDERDAWPDTWTGWRLWAELNALPGIGPTTASKLFSRKRPRLRPIYDTVVAEVIGTTRLWEPLRAELQDDVGLHPRLLRLRDRAGLPPQVTALRVFDVLTWMEGKSYAPCPWAKAAY